MAEKKYLMSVCAWDRERGGMGEEGGMCVCVCVCVGGGGNALALCCMKYLQLPHP